MLDTAYTAAQPMSIPNDQPAVWDLVKVDIAARDAAGADKYGTRLQPHNGRDALVDLYQELLDSVVYARQLLYERDGAQPPRPACQQVKDRKPKIDQIQAALESAQERRRASDEALRELGQLVSDFLGDGAVVEFESHELEHYLDAQAVVDAFRDDAEEDNSPNDAGRTYGADGRVAIDWNERENNQGTQE